MIIIDQQDNEIQVVPYILILIYYLFTFCFIVIQNEILKLKNKKKIMY
jgi:hypothetical protein